VLLLTLKQLKKISLPFTIKSYKSWYLGGKKRKSRIIIIINNDTKIKKKMHEMDLMEIDTNLVA